MNEVRCYIWNTKATEPREPTGDTVYLDSPRAGGTYAITGSAVPIVQKGNPELCARITTWLCNQRDAGVEYPRVTSDLVSTAATFPFLTTTQRVERALLYFNKNVRVGATVLINRGSTSEPTKDQLLLAALTESFSDSELQAFLELIASMHLLAVPNKALAYAHYTPSAQGWLQIDKLKSQSPSSTEAFVAMWFDPSMSDAFTQGIVPAIDESGYKPIRIDNVEHVNKIDDEIIAAIRRARFVVADFTAELGRPRGGVYYEAGFARGLGIPVIWTARADMFNELHFDTRQYNHISWTSPADLKEKLKARIGAVLGDGPLRALNV